MKRSWKHSTTRPAYSCARSYHITRHLTEQEVTIYFAIKHLVQITWFIPVGCFSYCSDDHEQVAWSSWITETLSLFNTQLMQLSSLHCSVTTWKLPIHLAGIVDLVSSQQKSSVNLQKPRYDTLHIRWMLFRLKHWWLFTNQCIYLLHFSR